MGRIIVAEVFKINSVFKIKKRVLILSGDPRSLVEIKKGLMDSFETVLASDSEKAADMLNTFSTDAVVIFINAGESARGFKNICDCAAEKNISVLFLAERDDESVERDAFMLGAADYSVKRGGVGEAFVKRVSLRAKSKAKPREKKGDTVLVAEDVSLNREIVDVMFAAMGEYKVEFADNGLEAVEKFKNGTENYALILMDIHMPKMDGLTAARTIRRLDCEAAKNIPIIALTAGTDGDDIAGFIDAGMNGYLKKPIEYEKLEEVIRVLDTGANE